jgi:hypothetical protein
LVSGRSLLSGSPTTTVATPEKFRKPVRNARRVAERLALLLVRGVFSVLSCWGSINLSEGTGDGPSADGRPGGCSVVVMLRRRDAMVEAGGRRRYQSGVSNGSSLTMLKTILAMRMQFATLAVNDGERSTDKGFMERCKLEKRTTHYHRR